MEMVLIAIGGKQPVWVNQGYAEYAKRLPRNCALRLVEIPLPKRPKNADPTPFIAREGEKMLAAIPAGARVVALDERGKAWSSRELSARLEDWMQDGRDVALLIGGPDGLAPACKARADEVWSLSPLTLPHGLARILVAEQLYRAWTLVSGHPYHRD